MGFAGKAAFGHFLPPDALLAKRTLSFKGAPASDEGRCKSRREARLDGRTTGREGILSHGQLKAVQFYAAGSSGNSSSGTITVDIFLVLVENFTVGMSLEKVDRQAESWLARAALSGRYCACALLPVTIQMLWS